MVAAEPADVALDTALLMRTLHAGLTVERLDAVVGPERGPPVRFHALAGEADHAGDRGLEVVVPDLACGDATEDTEGVAWPSKNAS